MKTLVAILLLFTAVTMSAAERVFLARFEVTAGAFEGTLKEREAIIFYTVGREVEVERVGRGSHGPRHISTFSSMRLLARLEKIDFPKIDYQKHFEVLSKRPERPGHSVVTMDGQEVEVEMKIGGAHVLFRVWNPDGFLWSHDDDKAAAAVNSAVEAFVLTLGKGAVFF
jgi:hypothetical protein